MLAYEISSRVDLNDSTRYAGRLLMNPTVSVSKVFLSPTITALVLVIGTLWGFFVHANVRWRFGILEHIVTTPFFHRWHHTGDTMRDRNYAAMFAFIDHMFGTYYAPDHWPTRYGIDAPMPASLGGQFLNPFLPAKWRPRRATPEATETAVERSRV